MHSRTSVMLACAAALAPITSFAAKPLLSNGPELTQAQEDLNEHLAITWHRNIMGGDRTLGLSLTDRNFIQHDVEEPSGSIEFVEFFTQPGGPPGPDGGPRSAANAALKAQAEAAKAAGKPLPATPLRPVTAPALQTRLFAITDGALSFWAYGSRGGDPGRFFGSNLVEVKNGKVTQEWYSGPTFTLPSDAKAADPAQWYPAPYQQVANTQFVVPIATATIAQREANKKLVSDFWDAFFVRKEAAAAQLLSPTLRNHIVDQPSGAEFANFARQNPGKVTSPKIDRPLFVMGEGDLVIIGYPVELLSDPGAWYTTNMVRVKEGKIVEWWYSGYPEGHPALRYGAAWPVGAGPRPGVAD
ncbi:MAG: hypothetical protein QM808_00650 [Steroidobacteraceae bacterium]